MLALPLVREPTRGGTQEKAAFRFNVTPFTGDAPLAEVTNAMVAAHPHYHHRKPVTAKPMVLGGAYAGVEKTMIELDRTTIVQETRSAFQAAMHVARRLNDHLVCALRTPRTLEPGALGTSWRERAMPAAMPPV